MILYAATNKYLMDLPVNKVRKFNRELVEFVKDKYPKILTSIAETGDINDEILQQMKSAVEEFKAQFV
jgi:F-type H+-transporting ATPase subunit alpha